MGDKLHPSHVTRISFGASSFDEICVNCGATDFIGGWGNLAKPCRPKNPTADRKYADIDDPSNTGLALLMKEPRP
jgi:hypothetical protein